MRICEAVFWDVDNTLVTSSAVFQAARSAAASAMMEAGLPVYSQEDALARLEALEAYFNGTWHASIFLLLCIDLGVNSQSERQKLVSTAVQAFDRAMEYFRPLPGVVETVAALRSSNIQQGIISNALYQTQMMKLTKAGLLHYFDPELILISSDAVPNEYVSETNFRDFGSLGAYVEGSCLYRVEKPWLTMFDRALERSHCLGKEALYIGDLATDIVGANAAGLTSVLLCPDRTLENTHPILNLEKPDFVIAHALQVLEIVGLR